MWLVREFPGVTFERYCDDAVIHCGSEEQARQVRDALAERLASVGLELHPDKTHVVYCKDADPAMGREIRSWHIARRSDKSLDDLALMFNSIVQGWINFYGRFYKSMLYPLLRRINDHLVRWAMRKFKRLRRREKRARLFLVSVFRRCPGLFAHWRFGLKPDGWTMGAV